MRQRPGACACRARHEAAAPAGAMPGRGFSGLAFLPGGRLLLPCLGRAAGLLPSVSQATLRLDRLDRLLSQTSKQASKVLSTKLRICRSSGAAQGLYCRAFSKGYLDWSLQKCWREGLNTPALRPLRLRGRAAPRRLCPFLIGPRPRRSRISSLAFTTHGFSARLRAITRWLTTLWLAASSLRVASHSSAKDNRNLVH